MQHLLFESAVHKITLTLEIMSNTGTVQNKLFCTVLLIEITSNTMQNNFKLECGPMPNMIVALPNIGGALCSTPQSLANAHY